MTDFVVGDGPGYQSEGWTTAEDGKVYAVNFFQDSVTGPYTGDYSVLFTLGGTMRTIFLTLAGVYGRR